MKLLSIAKWLFFSALFLAISSCNNEPEIPENDPGFADYISAHTSGVISAYSKIQFQLISDINPGVESGTPVDEEVFEFSPDIEGEATWLNASTIIFTPNEALPSGASFEGEFHLGKVMDVPGQFKTFDFLIQVIHQSYSVLEYNINPHSQRDLKWIQLKGLVQSADRASIDEMLEAISFTDVDNARVNWSTGTNDNRYYFTIDSLERKEEGYTMDAVVGDEVIGSFRIPSLSDFSVLSTFVENSPVQLIKVSFSDPILESQETSGLFTLNGINVDNVEIEGSVVTLYPSERLSGDIPLQISQGLKNVLGYRFPQDYTTTIKFEVRKPEVKFVDDGNIVPLTGEVSIPFQAVSLKAVDVKVYKVYSSNVHQFLQINSLNGDRELRRVARPIHQQKVDLTGDNVDYNNWTTFAIDLDKMIERDPGAIYRVELSFRHSYSMYPCSEEETDAMEASGYRPRDEDFDNFDRYGGYYYFSGYNYRERDNPCHISYYARNRSVEKNILATDLGLMVKGNDDSFTAYVSSLTTAAPVSGSQVLLYNYQGIEIGKGRTDSEGKVSIQADGVPFRVEARKGNQRSYLTLGYGNSLSLSSFDIGGVDVSSGIDAYMYAERGIWRPGDTVFLNAVINDEENPLPANHPVVLTIRDPEGKQLYRKSVQRGSGQILDFSFATGYESLTGTYRATLEIGGKTFYKSLPIETVLPNRYDIQVEAEGEILNPDDPNVSLHAEWLTGAKAIGAAFTMEGRLVGDYRPFEEYRRYSFHDRTLSIPSLSGDLLAEGNLDNEGDYSANVFSRNMRYASGPLKLIVSTKVFEPGGRFSIDNETLPLAPFNGYVGVDMSDANDYGYYETEQTHRVKLVTLDPMGEKVNSTVKVSIYKVNWSWWWSARNGNSTYSQSRSQQLVVSGTVTSRDGEATYDFEVPDDYWGSMLVIAEDQNSGHKSTTTFYADWARGRDRANRTSGEAVSILSITADKENYAVGDNVELSIPSSAGGRLIVSLEDGRRQIKTIAVNTNEGETKVNFKVTEEMVPNIYANAMIIQPHNQASNDLPIRLYGVIPILAENPQTHLNPEIEVAEKVRPESTLEVEVSERDGRRMEYTLAVVDEGLLGITGFSTPNPWNHFYAKQALGVRTWDMYDYVMSAFAGRIAQVLAVGGDAALNPVNEARADRFKPVVRHLGPFVLERGRSANHSIELPNYIGNLRVMVVAANAEEAYGSAAKNVRVVQPMMAQMTMPRVIGPGERVQIPVTVFALEDGVGEVTVRLNTSSTIQLDASSKSVRLNSTGQQTVYFEGTVADALGIATISMEATSRGEKSTEEIEISIRSPLLEQVREQDMVVQAQSSRSLEAVPFGVSTSNDLVVEVSSVPSINLGDRLHYLIQYPHGCLEQTTSKGFVQLHLQDWVEMTANQKGLAEEYVRQAIYRLRNLQMPDGGFRYWPSSTYASGWGSTYAGHFMLAAEERGVALPAGMKSSYLRFEKRMAQSWNVASPYQYNNDLNQAYRLYVLALAGEPEIGAMNRLRNRSNLSNAAARRLALAFNLIDEDRIARELVDYQSGVPVNSDYYYYTFGSYTRDLAMEVEALHHIGDEEETMRLALELAESLSEDEYRSTQDIAFSLYVLSQVFSSGSSGIKADVTIGGRTHQVNTSNVIVRIPKDDFESSQEISVVNNGESPIYVRVLKEGVPHYGEETNYQDRVNMTVEYYDPRTNRPLNISRMSIGTPIRVIVHISRSSNSRDYNDLALTQIFPSGWEISNSRVMGVSETGGSGLDYMDIRDDRIYSYFSLQRMSRDDVTITVDLTATYPGRWYLPPTTLEAMYHDRVKAGTVGQWIEVVNE